MKRNNKGISLVVLVITIIVMTILGGTVVITLSSNGIIDKANDAVDITNLKQVEELAAMLWAEAYMNPSINTKAQYQEYVMSELNKKNIDLSLYSISVDKKGVEVYPFPEDWKDGVSTIVSGVPIPKGFVASPYSDEDSKNEGLVIYELTTNNIKDGLITLPEDESQYTSWTTRNQYVWIPVEDFNNFVRKNLAATNLNTNLSSTPGASTYWEVLIDTTINMPNETSMLNYSAYYTVSTPSGGITNTLDEVIAMYESVKKYGGFYIARYEAGITTRRTATGETLAKGSDVYFVMGKKPYTFVPWTKNNTMNEDLGGAVEICRGLYPVTATTSNYGVVSTLVYGVQWDAACEFLRPDEKISNSVDYGNYSNHVVTSYLELNKDAEFSEDNGTSYDPVGSTYTKISGATHLYTTGALKAAKVKNVYDLAGNLREWVMEGNGTTNRVSRGGIFNNVGTFHINSRSTNTPESGRNYLGFRAALYIK